MSLNVSPIDQPRHQGVAGLAGPELAIVVPTYNERDNVGVLLARLRQACKGINWEVVFVDDDSPDGTAGAVRELGRHDPRVRCLQRIGRRGLSSAVIEGALASTAPFVAVIDADLQHDERLLPEMLALVRGGEVDLAVGSRHIEGGNFSGLNARRKWVSRVSSSLARHVLRIEVKDLMSGFFMIRREALEGSVRQLSGMGFKILLDIIASSPRQLQIAELPYEFRTRNAGESKLGANAAAAFFMLLIDKSFGRYFPARFVAFALVGGTGLLVHFAVLFLAMQGVGTGFVEAQALATVVAMTSNFAINNVFTYSDRRLRGWRWFTGWLSFCVACGLGAVANVGVAAALYGGDTSWELSAIAGAAVGTVWNFAVTRVYTWRKA